jgi:hypothetical protein
MFRQAGEREEVVERGTENQRETERKKKWVEELRSYSFLKPHRGFRLPVG